MLEDNDNGASLNKGDTNDSPLIPQELSEDAGCVGLTLNGNNTNGCQTADNESNNSHHNGDQVPSSQLATVPFHITEDIEWSLFSNTFFVGGGLCYIAVCSWDYRLGGSTQGLPSETLKVYKALWVLGPLVYLLNSIIDIAWATQAQWRDKRRRHLQKLFRKRHDESISLPLQLRNKKKRFRRMKPKKFMRRLRKHIGYRRQLSAAATFGIAAFFALVASIADLTGTLGENIPPTLEKISTHIYLVSAAFALCGRQSSAKPSGAWFDIWSNMDRLKNLGDAFFGAASIVDAILCDMTFDDDILWWPVISAILWLLDALLYLRADFVTLYNCNPNMYDTMEQLSDATWYACDYGKFVGESA